MNFDFSPEQLVFRDRVRTFFDRACPITRVRLALDGADDVPRSLWTEASDFGLPATAVSDAHGGLGLGSLELCIVAEACGRALAPIPFTESAGLATLALRRYAVPEVQARWLPGLAAGTQVAACVLPRRHESLFSAAEPLRLDGGLVRGCLDVAPDPLGADLLVTGAVDGQGSPVLAAIDLRAEAVGRRSRQSADPSRALSAFGFDGAPSQPLAVGAPAAAALAWLRNAMAVLVAFEQLGLADEALRRAVAYSQDRRTFGRTIGSYQAIKHKLAEVFVSNQLARAHAYCGAWALAADAPELPGAAAAARIACTDASMQAAQENLQVHGGLGYTWAADCHLFYRRARFYAAVAGSTLGWRRDLAVCLRQAPEAPAITHGA